MPSRGGVELRAGVTLLGYRIAVLGDLHGKWNDLDNAYFDRAGYDLLLFVGDLGSGSLGNGLTIIRQLARLRVPGLVLPGNNDATHLAQLAAELSHQSGKLEIYRVFGTTSRQALEPCGFSRHELTTRGGGVSLIAARPCAMGGSQFSFPEQLARNYGVSNLDASLVRLKQLVDAAESEHLLFVAHNGPYGLGSGPRDLWARDFELPSDAPAADIRDWGDWDLAQAIDYAKARGKHVLGVIAGHMHRPPQDAHRPLSVKKDGVLYVNVAVVPRISSGAAGPTHHHVELRIDPRGAPTLTVQEHYLTLP